MKKKIKALVFDAYGTLFDVHSVIATCNQKFPGQGPALSQAWRAKQLEYTWLRSLMGRYEDFWRVTESALVFACKSLNLPCPPATRAELMDAYLHLQPYPEVPQALRALSNHSRAILSNGSSRMLRAAVGSAGLEGMFSNVISVDAAKIYKPSPHVYQLACKKMRLTKTAVGFVSSNCWDVVGAQSFGFWTCWVNRSKAPVDELGFTPNVTVNSLADLVEVMKA
jgi:2-haloacid dehalogenase